MHSATEATESSIPLKDRLTRRLLRLTREHPAKRDDRPALRESSASGTIAFASRRSEMGRAQWRRSATSRRCAASGRRAHVGVGAAGASCAFMSEREPEPARVALSASTNRATPVRPISLWCFSRSRKSYPTMTTGSATVGRVVRVVGPEAGDGSASGLVTDARPGT